MRKMSKFKAKSCVECVAEPSAKTVENENPIKALRHMTL